ncbi:MAG TPA: ABC transporter ATP-binding protein [Mycobacterium sp.]|uniref:ABC transporter ATP-binding protein n=1 Tax=Mycobacterium sp. TaxID=1785 RepID=UPI002D7167BF|nr:ABC transporter ATP-binding protein [Mycobacterium sp.]HXY64785.1 ABC transporter ATP-binding protein [Mycobacterium sp.]
MGVAMEVERLSFEYAKGGPGLDDISLSLQVGQVCCLLGPNGAAKTTLLRCLLGLLAPQSGTLRLAGTSMERLSRRELARQVAYVPQASSTPFPFSTLDIAMTGRTPHMRTMTSPSAADQCAAAAVLDELGIGALADRPFSVLSGGERRLALMHVRWSKTRRCCCSTSPPPGWISATKRASSKRLPDWSSPAEPC